MRTGRLTLLTAVTATLIALTGCTADTGPVPTTPPPTTVAAEEIESDTVTIAVGETLVIEAEERPEAYRAVVLDATVAEFVAGAADPEPVAPSLVGLAPGTTDVVLSDPTGELDDISFSLTVVE